MSLSSLLDGHPEVLGAVTADLQGQPLASGAGGAAPGEADTAAYAVALTELASAGALLGLQHLEGLQVRSEAKATLALVRADAFLLAAVDPKRTGPAEKRLEAWRSPPGPGAQEPAPRPEEPPSTRQGPAPAPTTARARPAAGRDAWALLRRALVRGQLTEASAHARALDAAAAPGAGRAGSEPVPEPERERALRGLLEGIGSVLAGDGVGGGRTLRELADSAPRNLSFRWLALYWSVRAALVSGAFATASAAAKEALAAARQLDDEACAATHCVIGEVLSHGKDPGGALSWLTDARARFARLHDAWGLGQATLAQARVFALLGRESEAAEAARQACASDPDWDEPPVFLARRALIRGELAAAEQLLQSHATHAAERLRAVIAAVREGALTQADAAEYLREQHALPSARSIRALDRISRAAPRFTQARDALAWMLVKVGRYADATAFFRSLLGRELAPADRASVMLGLSCIAHAEAGSPASPAPAPSAGPALTPPPLPPSDIAALPAAAGSGVSGASVTVFSGQLSVFCLPDLLEFLRSGRRTGALVCSSPRGLAALHFCDGSVTSASSPATPRIGQVLVGRNKLAPDVLEAALRRLGPDAPDGALCEYLEHEGQVDRAGLRDALEHQVGLALRELLQWKDGEFAFHRDGEGTKAWRGAASPLVVDVQGVLMDAFREQDEAARDAAAGARA